MKFRFCGDADCPDWLLMQINTLSSLDSKQLEELCHQVMLTLLGQELKWEEAVGSCGSLESEEVKACCAAVRLIMRSAACYQVGPSDLSAELEQLGLHSSHASAFATVYSQHVTQLTLSLRKETIRMGQLKSWQMSELDEGVASVTVELSSQDNSGSTVKTFDMDSVQASQLIKDLRSIKKRIEDLQSNDP